MPAAPSSIVNLNASPYNVGKLDERLGVLRRRIERTGCPVVYVNLVGGQDELLFDGRSLVLDAGGSITAGAQAFGEEVLVADVAVGSPRRLGEDSAGPPCPGFSSQRPAGGHARSTAGHLPGGAPGARR